MDLVIVVKDSAGAPVNGAKAVRSGSGAPVQAITDAKGRVTLAALPTTLFVVDVTHPSYVDEQVSVIPQQEGGSFAWDNPVCAVIAPATIEVKMSRLRAAPTLSLSDKDLEQRDPFGPQAAFTWTDGNGNPTGRYLGMSNDRVQEFMTVSHPLLPETPTEGWGRISHEPGPIALDPSRTGDLVLARVGTRLGGAPPVRRCLDTPLPRDCQPA